jgi:adenylate cyclase
LSGLSPGKVTFIFPLILLILFAILTVNNPTVIDEYLEALLSDYRFKIRNIILDPQVPEDILAVLVDEKSLEKFGRWPWGRRLQAELIEKIFEGDPKVVALDIFYAESESPEADRALASVFQENRDRLVVALGFEATEGKKFEGEVSDVIFDQAIAKIQSVKHLKAIEAFRTLLPPEPIASSANFGHVYNLSDRDGKLRWESLYVKYGDEYFPSLALQTARMAKGLGADKISVLGGILVDMDGLLIPTDKFGRFHINYLGKEGTIIHTSAADILSGDVSSALFKDKIVLIGTSAIATYDLKNTPFSANMPGVEKNATVVHNILYGDFMTKSPLYMDLFTVLITGIMAILMGRGSLHAFIFYDLLIVGIILVNQLLFVFANYRVNLIYPLLTVISIGTFIISYRYLTEERKAREIRKMFSSYVTERVVDELIANPEMAKLGGDRREVTVLFSDISGFTTFSEKHEPEEVVSILNEYLAAMTDIVFRWEGTLDKFIGDAIVAFWGAPLKQDNHAELAVRCSLHMIKRLEELREKWISEDKTPLNIGIGLNTGEVLVGNI